MTTIDDQPRQTDAGYAQISLGDGRVASRYTLKFDREGSCTSLEHRADALEEAAAPRVTDVFLFAHGWNNDWQAATARYDSFIAGFGETRRAGHGLKLGDDFQPLLIGIFWPSTILVTASEQGPVIAGGDAGSHETALAELAAAFEPADREQLTALLRTDTLDSAGALALAKIVAPLVALDDDEAPEPFAAPSAEDLVAIWQQITDDEPAPTPGAGGVVKWPRSAGPRAAGFSLDPRKLLRILSVRTMKDRAGVVGAKGIAPLLGELLTATEGRVHMIGHSYGCKVCLSAICAEELPPGERVDSLLLLQPAVNHRCFAIDAGHGNPGGYRTALERVRQPILTTLSKHDIPLRTWFHHALTRGKDEGEASIAALPSVPSPYAALGGYGPRGAELETEAVDLLDPGTRYAPARTSTRLVAVDGARGISGHGDISTPFTWWALYDQVAAR